MKRAAIGGAAALALTLFAALLVFLTTGAEQPTADCTPTATPVSAPTDAEGADLAAAAALAAGWTGRDAVVAVAVAGAESTYNPEAANSSSTARGMWQVMLSLHLPLFNGDDWRDPYANARVAYHLWQQSGWQPWVAYTSMAYLRFMDEAERAVAAATQGTVQPVNTGADGLQPVAQRAAAHVRSAFGFTGTIGGWGTRGNATKHDEGLAIDVMLDADVPAEEALGDRVAAYFAGEGAVAFGVDNVIWKQQITNAGRGWAWGPMEDRGSKTANHYDHVHIDFHPDGGSSTVPAVAPLPSECTATTATAATGDVVYPVDASTDRRNYGNSGSSWSNGHTGTDFSIGCGTPVVAAHAGTVVVDTSQAWAGPWLVKVTTSPGSLTTWYAHMQAVTVQAGQQVAAGQQIGEVGTKGNSTGCHLHFEVHPRNGSIYEDGIDPSTWLAENTGRSGGVIPVSNPTGGAITVVTANVPFSMGATAAQTAIRSLARPGVDVILFQEVRERPLRAWLPGWTVHQPRPYAGAVAVRPGLRVVAAGATHAFQHPRYGRVYPWAVVADTAGGTHAVVSVHMPVAARRHPMMRRLYAVAVRNLAALVSSLRARGHSPIVGGDWNSPLGTQPDSWGAVASLRRLGMATNWQSGDACTRSSIHGGKIDGFGYDPRRLRLLGHTCLPRNGADHYPVVGRFATIGATP